MNRNRGDILRNILRATAGLFIFSFGTYLTIRANVGVSPWDTLNLGLSGTFGVKYGTASITVSLIVLTVDLFLREPIGIGMLLDAFLIGKFVDLFNWLDLVPLQGSLLPGMAAMVGGIAIMGISQVFYMGAGLGCGPRDALMVGLGKRFRRIPIGIILIFVLAIVTLAGWLLGGPIGLGTLFCTFCAGPIMQGTYRLMRFDPTAVTHQDLLTSGRLLAERGNRP